MYDIVVIGAGVVGGMIARELVRYRVSVCILEKQSDVAMGASKANSGIVHAGFDAKEGTLKALLNVRGSEMMESVAEELGVHYRKNGSLVVGFTDEDMRAIAALYERGCKNNVRGLKILRAEEVRALEPNIADTVIGALYAPTGAIVCPYMLTVASIGNAMDNGAVLKTDFEVVSIAEKDGIYSISSPSETVEAKYIINAAGAFADAVADMAGYGGFTVTPRKGEYLLLDRECGDTVDRTIFKVPTKMGKGILVSPTADGNLLLGPTSVNVEDKENTETTQDGIDAIISGASECVKNIPLRSVITSFTGLRAVGDTGDFIIEIAGWHFVNVAGIESPGLSSAPAIAEYVVALLREDGLRLEPNTNFSPARRLYRAPEEKYHKVICRCETISEGEILTAIHTNPGAKDIDGVKRRTRSGMGRCQGGFCMPYVAEILARELGIPLTEVTKFGGASKLLVGKSKEVHA